MSDAPQDSEPGLPIEVVANNIHGPSITTLTTANVLETIVTAPGVGKHIYVSSLVACAGALSGNSTHLRIEYGHGTLPNIVRCMGYIAKQGGIFPLYFDPPWKLPENQLLYGVIRVTPPDVVLVTTMFTTALS